MIKLLYFFYFLLFFISSLYADTTSLSSKSLEQLFDDILYADACRSADAGFKKKSDPFQKNLVIGLCALHKGDADSAFAAFDRAEIIDENNYLVHQYLGDLHARIGNFDLAKTEYDRADLLADSPVIRLPVTNKEPHKVSMLLEIDRGFDDNVKLFASISDLNNWFGPANFPIEAVSDRFNREDMQISHLYDGDLSSSFYYRSLFQAININYDRFHEDNSLQGVIQTGPAWAIEKLDIWLPLRYLKVGIDGNPYNESYSVRPQIAVQWDNTLIFTVEAAYEYMRYLQWSSGDYHLYSCEFKINKLFGDNGFSAEFHYLDAKKVDPQSLLLYIDNVSNQLNLEYTRKINKAIDFNLDLMYRFTYYDDLINTISFNKRNDKIQQYEVNLSYKATDNVAVRIEYSYYDNETNYLPYNYTQSIVSVGVIVHI